MDYISYLSLISKKKLEKRRIQKRRKAIITAAAAAAVVAAPFAINAVANAVSKRKNPPIGTFAEIGGKRMHIFKEGSGEHTIVFLADSHQMAPAIDFMPISARLRTVFRCVTPEPFGCGYSDGTTVERALQNIVSEIRGGLLMSGIRPPYTLYAQGDAGMLSTYWAARYPKEVECVIGSDAWIAAQEVGHDRCSKLLSLANNYGVVRFAIALGAGRARFESVTAFDRSKISSVKALAARNLMSKTQIDARNHMRESYGYVARLRYPQKCGLLMFVSQGMMESMEREGIDWVSEHEKQTVQSACGQCHALRGGTYLHREQADFIAGAIREYFAQQQAVE